VRFHALTARRDVQIHQCLSTFAQHREGGPEHPCVSRCELRLGKPNERAINTAGALSATPSQKEFETVIPEL
jgi:hypothetical protein